MFGLIETGQGQLSWGEMYLMIPQTVGLPE
jgi:hypothetical protein